MSSSEIIVITGPIASGKSTIGYLVAEESEFTFFPEDVDTSPLDRDILERYYRAVEDFTGLKGRDDSQSLDAIEEAREDVYDTQVHFIGKRSSMLKGITREGAKAIVERHPWDDIHIFSRRNLNYGLLTAAQFESLERLVDERIQGIAQPRVMVFLSAEPESLRRRIQKRGREQERDLLSPENPYLAEIAELYEDWFARYEAEAFRVQTDWLTEKEVVSRIAKELHARGVSMTRRIRETREVRG